MEELVRPPAVAGRFYPRNPGALLREIESYTSAAARKIAAVGCVVPHAGYMYSGHVAGAVYGTLDLPRRFIILCPNHTGVGEPLALSREDRWLTPLGEVPVDAELTAALKREFPLLAEDTLAHRAEHALEVQLPFLQALVKEFTFVPIAVGVGRFEVLEALGNAIAKVAAQEQGRVLLISSSDMNHYESDAVTRVKDAKAIQKILSLDARGLYEVVTNEDVSMCGYAPTVAMLTAAKEMGAKSARIVRYATSGDVSGERDMVVGYAGVIVTP
jgi:hypothetical protein